MSSCFKIANNLPRAIVVNVSFCWPHQAMRFSFLVLLWTSKANDEHTDPIKSNEVTSTIFFFLCIESKRIHHRTCHLSRTVDLFHFSLSIINLSTPEFVIIHFYPVVSIVLIFILILLAVPKSHLILHRIAIIHDIVYEFMRERRKKNV